MRCSERIARPDSRALVVDSRRALTLASFARAGGLTAAKIDVVSVGTRAGLLEFHDVLLELLGEGEWRISRPVSSRQPAG
jgi:hypothetical protein